MTERWSKIVHALLLALQLSLSSGTRSHVKPNIVFILTDDQDLHMNSLEFMPSLQRNLVSAGTSYQRHYCTISLCCPSRANLWTGLLSHNTNVTDLFPPYGGYPAFMAKGFNDAYLPIWMRAAGYSTYYIGKFLNYHNIGNYDKPFPAGWTGTEFLLEPYTYQYYNPSFQRNRDAPVNNSGSYNTDLVTEKTLAFLDDAVEGGEPFFLVSAPIAPHSTVEIQGSLINGTFEDTGALILPPVPAKRYERLFPDVVVPRTSNFNPPDSNGVAWISDLPRQNQTNIDYNDSWHRDRLRTLQSVDELIDSVVARLEAHGVLDNTYIFYTTDNGYHIGQHRLQPGKQCAYQEDVNIPLLVRGPGVATNRTTEIVTSMTDFSPTFLSLAGAPMRENFDGKPFPILASELDRAENGKMFGEHINLEHWGSAMPEGKFSGMVQPNNTYKAIRVVGGSYDLLYTVWCTEDHELYDLANDPYETENLYHLYSYNSTDSTDFGQSTMDKRMSWVKRLVPRLDALVLVGRTCKGESCRNPWGVLHPQGNVQSLEEALAPEYDQFYEEKQNKVKFGECIRPYFVENELPVAVIPFEPERL